MRWFGRGDLDAMLARDHARAHRGEIGVLAGAVDPVPYGVFYGVVMTVERSALTVACAAFMLSVTSGARAASFDCAQAATRTERVICTTRALNDQDVRMAVMLDVLAQFELMGGRAQQRDDQRSWLKQREACDAAPACLTRVYKRRVNALHSQIEGLADAHR